MNKEYRLIQDLKTNKVYIIRYLEWWQQKDDSFLPVDVTEDYHYIKRTEKTRREAEMRGKKNKKIEERKKKMWINDDSNNNPNGIEYIPMGNEYPDYDPMLS